MRVQPYLFLLVLITSPVYASTLQPYIIAESIAYSKPVSIRAIIDEWQPPYYGGDEALTYSKLEAGVAWQNWQLGILKRCDYQIQFSPQTAEFLFLTNNQLPLETGKEYKLHITTQHNCSSGMKLGRNQRLGSTLNAHIAISVLNGEALTDGTLEGHALATSDKDYNFQFDTDYRYSRDVLFGRHVSTPKGFGYGLDLGLDWQPTEDFSARLEIVDLFAEMRWDDAPSTVATATSNTKSYDEAGYVRYDPTISGFESYQSFTQTLPRKLFFDAQYRLGTQLQLLAEYRDFKIEQFTSLGGGWHLGEHRFQGLYTVDVEAFTLRYRWQQLHLEFGTETIDIDRLRFVNFQLTYNRPF